MASTSAKPARPTLRTHSLVGVLNALALLWPCASLAFLDAPLTPIYKVAPYGGKTGCGEYSISKVPGTSCSSLFGYLNSTQIAGTVPLYRVGTWITSRGCSEPYNVSKTPGARCSSLLGYVNTTQVADTSPVYTQRTYWGRQGCIEPTLLSYTSGTCSGFLGYIYRTTPPPITFTLSPGYFIGSVIYVPPGAGSSSVTYAAGAITGTTVSTTSSWNRESSVGIQIGTSSDNHSITFGDSFGGSTTNSVDMQVTSTQSTTYRPPPSDLINHDYDQILIFLGVKVIGSADYLGNVTWSTDFSQVASQGFATTGYPVSVGCLRPNSSIPPLQCSATLDLLSSAGVTSDDYPNMLAAHPFADPSAPPTPDPDRYVMVAAVSYFFDPVASTYTYTVNNSSMITNTRTTSHSYSVATGANINIPPVLRVSNRFTWTNSSTESNRTGGTASSTLTLSNPSATYLGPYTLFVYLDTIYKTFMFSFDY
jgi:hypothetical protein